MTRVLIVGMNPSNTPENKKVCKNSTFDRLNKWMTHLGIEHYSFINAVDKRADQLYQGDVDQIQLQLAASSYKFVIALGGFAGEALKRARVKHYKLPHPSPLNRVLNDKQYEKDVLRDCGAWINGTYPYHKDRNQRFEDSKTIEAVSRRLGWTE